jgi:hypothetical protein
MTGQQKFTVQCMTSEMFVNTGGKNILIVLVLGSLDVGLRLPVNVQQKI